MRVLPGAIALGVGMSFIAGTFWAKSTAAGTTHVVISEIQAAGDDADDEFIELYNPTDSSISLNGWRLRRLTSGGGGANLVASLSGTIAAHSYFLIVSPSYDGSALPDQVYSATTSAFTANATLLLYQDAGITVVDKVGIGTASNFEASPAPAPAANGSVERKPGNTDPLGGNGEDTDNNAADFAVRTESEPQNSQSDPEPQTTPSPSPTTTPTPTPEPTLPPTPTLNPTATPSAEPTITHTPSPSPTGASSPTPTIAPNPRPIVPSRQFPFNLFRSPSWPFLRP